MSQKLLENFFFFSEITILTSKKIKAIMNIVLCFC